MGSSWSQSPSNGTLAILLPDKRSMTKSKRQKADKKKLSPRKLQDKEIKHDDMRGSSQKPKQPSPEVIQINEHHQTRSKWSNFWWCLFLAEFSLLPQATGRTGTGLDTNNYEQSEQIHETSWDTIVAYCHAFTIVSWNYLFTDCRKHSFWRSDPVITCRHFKEWTESTAVNWWNLKSTRTECVRSKGLVGIAAGSSGYQGKPLCLALSLLQPCS